MSTGNPAETADLEYPDSDGQPMADNTLQWDWMVKIVGELRVIFAKQDVFVAGDLLWYPVQGEPRTRVAPDALVAFGRPSGYRGSYKQWREDDIAPQVVFEVLSPKNTADEMAGKRDFYERFGVEEYYVIDPYQNTVEGYRRLGDRLAPVTRMNGYKSPRLGIRFVTTAEGLIVLTPDGREFQTREEQVVELLEEVRRTAEAAEQEREWAAAETRRANTERERADSERLRADAEKQRADAEKTAKEALLAKLRELGVNPDEVLKRTDS